MLTSDDQSDAGGEREQAVPADELKRSDYLRVARTHLRNGMQKEAFKVLQQAAVQFPDDPLILSYFGCLQAVVDKKFRTGVETCRHALDLLKARDLFEEEVLYPVFHLNLARAYLAAGKKKDAIAALHDGLTYDRDNTELKKELRSLGERKTPVIPFLERTNPINKYIGKLLNPAKKTPVKSRSKSAKRS